MSVVATNRSFKEYVADRFENELFSAIENYVTENQDNLDLRLYKVRNIGGIEVSDTDVKYVSVNDLPEMKIEFEVVMEAELEVRESDHHYDESEICRPWFMLKCSGDLECSLDDFKILNVTEHNSKNKQPRPMSDSLVPIIHKEQLESVATDFLSRHFPEALKTPMALEPQELAEKMGLSLEIRNITKDFSVFGQLYFHECMADFYDETNDEIVNINVNARTIFVDPKAYFLRNLGSVNNTIVHECVHWDLHRKAFELERLYNSSASRIKCKVAGGIKDNNRDSTDWMEWHANALTPKIQMPLAMFKTMAYKYLKQYREEVGSSEILDVIEPVIDSLAVFFGVSRLAAKIRMVDVGFEETIGAFTYIDGHYVKPHRFKKGALEKNQTFSIGAIDAAIQSLTNTQIKNGSYIYVDSHFVLNHQKYITKDLFGETVLTDYARTHMDECCLIFDLSVKSGVKEKYYSECFLNRDETSSISFEITYKDGYQYATPEKQNELLRKTLIEDNEIYSQLTTDYCACLDFVREKRGVTYKELGERTLMDERTVRRIINGESNGTINSLVSICLALHLSPRISNHIISHSPHSLRLQDESHGWYDFALTHLYPMSMKEIRAFLLDKGAAL